MEIVFFYASLVLILSVITAVSAWNEQKLERL